MNSTMTWLGRTIAAGAAALLVLGGAALAQNAPAPSSAPIVVAADAGATPASVPAAAAAPDQAPAAAAAAPPAPKIDTGDTAWMLTSTALVLLMTIPGLALFYGGMVRKKNVLATTAQSFAITGLVTVLWMILG